MFRRSITKHIWPQIKPNNKQPEQGTTYEVIIQLNTELMRVKTFNIPKKKVSHLTRSRVRHFVIPDRRILVHTSLRRLSIA
jgi:hypothetical protein